MHINCIVIDDTPLAIEKLVGFIGQVPTLHLSGTFSNGLDALLFMKSNPVNLVFLDIQMEQFSGLQFLSVLQQPPQIIIVSAYSEYAIDGFNYAVTDYLLKPYSFERFLKAIDKIQTEKGLSESKDYMFVKSEYRMERIDFSEVLYIEGKGAYLRIVGTKSKTMTLMNFQVMTDLLPAGQFLRVHKSYIVAMNKIDHVERNTLKIGDQRIPIGQSYREKFFKALHLTE
ncbi:MAG: LytTR family DNA-binding domain-containing protein [Bacteroidetes bacterium]|nr:LytTR family DNA-binding domain-containing protein [Bacteroidota bacterium]